MKLRALTGLARTIDPIAAGEIFEEPNEAAAQRLIDAGHAEKVATKPSDLKETATSKPAAQRETRGGKND